MATSYNSFIYLLKNIEKSMNQEKYAQIIDSLIYLFNRTRLDIAYAISRLSRYISNPYIIHWIALNSVFRYLKGTINFSLYFIYYPNVLMGCSDSN